MRKGLSEPIIKDITFKESVFHIKLNYIINVRTIKDSSKRIVSYNLITHYI
jgi:hypothetical protein